MAILPVIVAPDPRLKRNCRPVGAVDDEVRRLMDNMEESMHAANGIGLAAPQVGIDRRVIVVHVVREEEEWGPYRMADPEIIWASDGEESREEGCLSLPEHFAHVSRPARVRVRYRDYDDQVLEMEIEGLLGACIQHEMDHLDGVLFVDHISALKRNIILRKLVKTKKADEAEKKGRGLKPAPKAVVN